jgi:hypothetical protein
MRTSCDPIADPCGEEKRVKRKEEGGRRKEEKGGVRGGRKKIGQV